jgi:hypothetical protein
VDHATFHISQDGRPAVHGHARISKAQQGSIAPELDFEEDELFYDNPELVVLDSDDEEQGEIEVEVQGSSRRGPTIIDPNSLKHIFREETWSQSTNEYEHLPLPFLGDPLGVKKIYRRMPSFLHLFGFFLDP